MSIHTASCSTARPPSPATSAAHASAAATSTLLRRPSSIADDTSDTSDTSAGLFRPLSRPWPLPPPLAAAPPDALPPRASPRCLDDGAIRSTDRWAAPPPPRAPLFCQAKRSGATRRERRDSASPPSEGPIRKPLHERTSRRHARYVDARTAGSRWEKPLEARGNIVLSASRRSVVPSGVPSRAITAPQIRMITLSGGAFSRSGALLPDAGGACTTCEGMRWVRGRCSSGGGATG